MSLQVLSRFYTPFCNTEGTEVSYAVFLDCMMHFIYDTLQAHVASVNILISCHGEETISV